MLPHTVTLPPGHAALLGLPPTLRVSRVWPRRGGRLTVELVGDDGALLAGQWFAHPGDRDRIAHATQARAGRPEHAPLAASQDAHGRDSGAVLVQARGADRRLRALPGLLAEAGATLLVHRPERRAVVHRPGDGAGDYLRVVRPGRTEPLVRAASDAVGLLAGLPAVTAPMVSAVDDDAGVLVTTGLPGRSLRELGGAGAAAAVTGAAGLGRLLRHLGRVERPGHLARRDHRAELTWVGTWLGRVADHLPHVHRRLAPRLEIVAARLADTTPGPLAVVHGDLHDGQVLVADGGPLGVLDWDTVAAGEGALDAANVWAHADLRRLLGQWAAEHAAAVWQGVLAGWQPAPAELARAGAYRRLLLLRLACQYAFRPGHEAVVTDLAALATD